MTEISLRQTQQQCLFPEIMTDPVLSSFTQELLNFTRRDVAVKFLKCILFASSFFQEETDLSKFLPLTPKQSSWLNCTTGFDLWVNCILSLILKSWSRKCVFREHNVTNLYRKINHLLCLMLSSPRSSLLWKKVNGEQSADFSTV